MPNGHLDSETERIVVILELDILSRQLEASYRQATRPIWSQK